MSFNLIYGFRYLQFKPDALHRFGHEAPLKVYGNLKEQTKTCKSLSDLPLIIHQQKKEESVHATHQYLLLNPHQLKEA